MKNKIISTILTLILIILFIPSFSFAQTDTSTGSSIPNPKKTITPGQRQLEIQTNRVAKLKEKAIREIDRRITALNKLSTRINKIKRLSSTEKTSLTNQIQEQITNLTNLKTKINSDTDIETLKTDVKSIILSYRIYLLFIPKIHILTSSDVILEATDKLTELANKLQTRINEQKAAGKDVSSLEKALNDMQNKIADAKKQAQSAIDTVTPLTPEGYPDNKTKLQEARKMLQTGRHELQQAKQDGRTIINGLKGVKESSKTATSSSE